MNRSLPKLIDSTFKNILNLIVEELGSIKAFYIYKWISQIIKIATITRQTILINSVL